jgi:hypothetical protein
MVGRDDVLAELVDTRLSRIPIGRQLERRAVAVDCFELFTDRIEVEASLLTGVVETSRSSAAVVQTQSLEEAYA